MTLTPSMLWALESQRYIEETLNEDESEDGLEVPDISYWRHSLREDVPQIMKMFRIPHTTSMFGTVDIDLQLELAHTALTQINAEGSIVSYLALFEYPNIPVVPSFGWLEWIQNLYGIEFADERNTLFIHLLLWKKRYTHDFLLPLLETVFLNNVQVQQIVLVLPPLVALPDVMEEFFMVENPLDPMRSSMEMNTLQRLAICLRHSIVPRFKMRKAVESDHDDIAPIFNKLTNTFHHSYGKYYVAEIIAHPTEGRQCIVGERNQLAIGMMCLNNDIDLDTLNEHFELAVFNGLHKWNEEDFIPFAEDSTDDSRENFRLTAMEDVDQLEMYTPEKLQMEAPGRESEAKIWVTPKTSRISTSSGSQSSSSYSSSEDFYLESMEEATMVKDRYYEEVDEEVPDASYDIEYSPMATRHRNTIVDVALDAKGLKASARHPMKDRTYRDVPEYFGESNAFSIEMFGLRDDLDERMAYDFLEAAFDCFPHLDYAVLTCKPEYPTFPLLHHFVRATPRKEHGFPHELFVAHRSSVLGDIRVRHAERTDLVHVKALVTDLPSEDDLVEECMSAIQDFDSPFRAFVLTVECVVIGVAVIQPVGDLDYMLSHYDVDALSEVHLHKDGMHATLEHLVLCPPFSTHIRFFLREIQRLSDVGCLYHRQPARRPRPEPHERLHAFPQSDAGVGARLPR